MSAPGPATADRPATDVAQSRKSEHHANHDPLTDLPNRPHFNDLVDEALTHRPVSAAVLMIDLDDFKLVNDVAGQAEGDALLCAVADRLRSCIRRTDVAARLGGDEFAVLLRGVADKDDALAAAHHVHQELRQPLEIGGELVVHGSSIGVTLVLPDDTVTDVMRRADVALYAAKNQGKDTVASFDRHLFELMKQRHGLVRDLERAITSGDVRVAYQPIVDLHNGRIHSVETLARWTDATGQPIPPAVFVRAAEEHGLIVPLFDHILRRSLREAHPWFARRPDLRLHVNLSPMQMRQPNLASTIEAVLSEASVSANNLCIEITESVFAPDQPVTKQNLAMLAQIGASICLDDFGTGYSSLSYLMRFAPSMLKLDRSFVDEMSRIGDARLPRAILGLARELEIEGVAEGIETVEQWQELRDLGWRLGQGFLMSEAISPEEFGRMLNAQLLPPQ